MTDPNQIPSFSQTIQGTLVNMGMATPFSRFIVAGLGTLAVFFLLKPSVAFNGDGTTKSFFMLSKDPKSPKTVLHPYVVSLAMGIMAAVFL